MPFDITTFCANDWQHLDGVLSATLSSMDADQTASATYAVKVLWVEGEPYRIPLGQRLGLSPVESALYLWAAGSGLTAVSHGDAIAIESVNYSIINVRYTRRSYWEIEVTKQEVNV